MKRTACLLSCTHSARRPFNRTISSVLLLLLAGAILTVNAARTSRQRPLSLDEINNRLASLQGTVDSLTQVVSTLKQDSSRLKQEAMQLSSSLGKRQSEIDELIAGKKGILSGLRSHYE